MAYKSDLPDMIEFPNLGAVGTPWAFGQPLPGIPSTTGSLPNLKEITELQYTTLFPKNVWIFDHLKTIAVYDPTISPQLSVYGSYAFYFDYEEMATELLLAYRSLAHTNKYDFKNVDRNLEAEEAVTGDQIAEVDKFRFIYDAWFARLTNKDFSAGKKPGFILNKWWIDWMTGESFKKYFPTKYADHLAIGKAIPPITVEAHNSANVRLGASPSYPIRIGGKTYQQGGAGNSLVNIGPHMDIYEDTSGRGYSFSAGLMKSDQFVSEKMKKMLFHQLSYFPPGTVCKRMLNSVVFYDPADPKSLDRLKSIYGGDYNTLYEKIKNIRNRITYGDIISFGGICDKKDSKGFLTCRDDENGYSIVVDLAKIGFPEGTRFYLDYQLFFNQQTTLQAVQNTEEGATVSPGMIEKFDGGMFSFPQQDTAIHWKVGKMMNSSRFVSMMKYRDTFILNMLRGGMIPLSASGSFNRYACNFYDIDASGLIKGIKLHPEGVFLPVTNIYPVYLMTERDDPGFWGNLVTILSYTPIGLVVRAAVYLLKELKEALPEELRGLVDVTLIAAISIGFSVATAGLGLPAAAASVGVAESANPNLWRDVAGAAMNVVKETTNSVVLNAISIDQMAQTAEQVVKSVSDKDRLICVAIARVIDRKFGKTALGGSDGGGATYADLVQWEKAEVSKTRGLGTAALIVGGAVVLKLILDKKK